MTVATPDIINEPGDVITESIAITTANGTVFDISAYALSTTLYEDMFSNTLSGFVVILDAGNLVNIIPLQGTEYLTFSFRTPSFTETISKMFKITSVSDRVFSATEREQTYTISFVSMEAAIDNVSSLSQKFSGTTDAVVAKIWQNNLTFPRFGYTSKPTPVVVSPGTHASTVSFVAPSWSPFKAINWVANRSFRTAGEYPGFLWFETNKAFHFRNTEEMISSQNDQNLVFAQYSYFPVASNMSPLPKNNTIYTKPDLPKQYGLARNMKSFNMFDIFKGQDHGFYAAKLMVHDLTLQTYQESFFDYYAPYAKEVTPNKNPDAFPEGVFRNANAFQTVRTKHYKLFNDYRDPLYEKWMLQRNSLLYEFHSVRVEIEVPGRTDIEAGKLVDFVYPKAVDKNTSVANTDVLDPFMTARYLITAIRHTFALNKHTMWLELTRII